MGADTFISALAVPRGASLDWEAAEPAIRALNRQELERIADELGWDEDNGDIAERLRTAVQAAREALTGGSRELDVLEFGTWDIYLTGGLSTGDTPTDLFDIFWALGSSGLDRAIGFGWPSSTPDHGRVVMEQLPCAASDPVIAELLADPAISAAAPRAVNLIARAVDQIGATMTRHEPSTHLEAAIRSDCPSQMFGDLVAGGDDRLATELLVWGLLHPEQGLGRSVREAIRGGGVSSAA